MLLWNSLNVNYFLKGMGITILKLGKNLVLIDRYCLNQGISSLIWKCIKNIYRR